MAYFPFNGTWQSIYTQITVKAGDTISGSGGTFASAASLPAGWGAVGGTYVIEFRGNYTTPAVTAPMTTAQVKIGSTVIVATPALSNPTGASGYGYSGIVTMVVEAIGTSGKVRAGGTLTFNSSSTGSITVVVPDVETTVDTTAAQTLTLGAVFSVSATGNSNQMTFLAVRYAPPVAASN